MGKNDLLSYGSIVQNNPNEKSNRHIVAISGGASSAYVANWVKENINCEIVYYFNDTKWEHQDLYRFLKDIENALNIEITSDSDGRNPEQIFYDQKMLGSNMAPICSKILKAERLQNFVKPGDTLYFGIDGHELHRAARITPIYERLQCKCVFPLIDNGVGRKDIFDFIKSKNIDIPQMYKDGFTHNNCSGGCVRAGEKQWISLLNTYPDVYADRERIEKEFTEWNQKRRKGKDPDYVPVEYTFLKNISLKTLREKHEQGLEFDFGDDEWQGECIGICGRMY